MGFSVLGKLGAASQVILDARSMEQVAAVRLRHNLPYGGRPSLCSCCIPHLCRDRMLLLWGIYCGFCFEYVVVE